jgi:hypothetical protein
MSKGEAVNICAAVQRLKLQALLAPSQYCATSSHHVRRLTCKPVSFNDSVRPSESKSGADSCIDVLLTEVRTESRKPEFTCTMARGDGCDVPFIAETSG